MELPPGGETGDKQVNRQKIITRSKSTVHSQVFNWAVNMSQALGIHQ